VNHKTTKRKRWANVLNDLYERYNWRRYVHSDPLVFLYDYDDIRDQEIVGLIASSLAYGNVKQISKSVDGVLSLMGASPAHFLEMSTPRAIERRFSSFKHRWTTGWDLASMLKGAKQVMEKYGSLESCFTYGLETSDVDTVGALTHFVSELKGADGDSHDSLLPSPCRNSACKRLHLFLRWMVRSDRVDPGGWTEVPASKLLVPLDRHMYRFAMDTGLTERKQPNLHTAREVTEAFREISPEDPVKYDFALTRLGILRIDDQKKLMRQLGMNKGSRIEGDIAWRV
jgi:uncharacterized protein (TIGR02757 family)